MNTDQFLLELSKAISVDGRVNVDRYCKVLELIEAYKSSNYSNTPVSGQVCICGNALLEKEVYYETCLQCGADV